MIKVIIERRPSNNLCVEVNGLTRGQRMVVHQAAQEVRWREWRTHTQTADLIAKAAEHEHVCIEIPHCMAEQNAEFVDAILTAIRGFGCKIDSVDVMDECFEFGAVV